MTEFDTTSPHHTDAAQGRQSKPSARGAAFNRCPGQAQQHVAARTIQRSVGLAPLAGGDDLRHNSVGTTSRTQTNTRYPSYERNASCDRGHMRSSRGRHIETDVT